MAAGSPAGIVSAVVPVVLPVLLATAAGYGWGRLRQPFDHTFVTRLITHIGAPCLVFSALSQEPPGGGRMAAIAVATLCCLALFAGLGSLGLRLAGLPQRVFLPSLTFPNVGNVGLPVCLFAFGPEGLALAMVYFTITSVLQFTVGEAIAAGRWRPAALLRVPFLYAALFALLASHMNLAVPSWVTNTATLLGGLAVPLMLLALGVALAELRIAYLRRALLIALARLGLGLVVGLAVARLLDLHDAARGVLLIQSMMPVAVFNYLFARMYGNAPEEVAGAVVASTLLSFLTLPLVVVAATTPF